MWEKKMGGVRYRVCSSRCSADSDRFVSKPRSEKTDVRIEFLVKRLPHADHATEPYEPRRSLTCRSMTTLLFPSTANLCSSRWYNTIVAESSDKYDGID